ncbi:HTH-type transcriptional regulator immR [Alloiococcus otitis]|uniref:HTH cro/C1-type domain-containing protein n=1 Tax=Alloiococcus otitis ATCC 51267 TaxID=883081 RepID=K9EW49_9LACT|nr:helix-turn-helix transcriptional regulator [Alloiococcus otitis]EKU93390.1 hypothetical protein HMPREF9698_01138 [Alloiococcus otitis ATCC 51267]SUU81607.1 HTH-type transcriptional regulator immR [Alloiococcus otitis]
MDLSSYIGNKLRYYRKENKMTQDELAKKLGLGKGTISNYESGYRTPQEHRLFELAEALNISINDLFPPTAKTDDIVKKIAEVSTQLEEVRQQKVYNFAEHQLKQQNGEIDDTILFAAHTKDDLTDEEKQQINDFIDKVRKEKKESR